MLFGGEISLETPMEAAIENGQVTCYNRLAIFLEKNTPQHGPPIDDNQKPPIDEQKNSGHFI